MCFEREPFDEKFERLSMSVTDHTSIPQNLLSTSKQINYDFNGSHTPERLQIRRIKSGNNIISLLVKDQTFDQGTSCGLSRIGLETKFASSESYESRLKSTNNPNTIKQVPCASRGQAAPHVVADSRL